MTALRQFLTELRRRRVIRVLILYAIAGWAIIQIASTVLPGLNVPQWSVTLVIVLVALGLPLAAILAWAFDVGDDGLKRTGPARTEVDTVGASPEASVRPAPASVPATPPVPSVTSTSTRRDAIRHSVAVLPFANLTGDATKDFLGHALAEELIHTLARVPGLRVPARTSSFAYQGHDIDVRRVASDLDVGTVLEGSVRAAGERIRITAQLIDGHSGYHLWSQHFDRRAEDLFELQDELANAIILQTLNVTLQGSGQQSLLRGPPTQNLEAYRHYLEAMGELTRQGSPTRSMFNKLQLALKLDPGFAQARASLAQGLTMAIVFGVPLPVTLADAEHQARQALDSDLNSGATYAALGAIQAAQARWLEAEANFQHALTLDDANPWIWHTHALSVLGNTGHVRALQSHARECHRLAPAWALAHMQLAFSSHLLGSDDESRTHVQAASELGMARAGVPLVFVLLQAELRAGHYDAARALIQELFVATNRTSRELEVLNCVLDAFAGSTSRSAAVAALDGMLAGEGLAGLPEFLRRLLIVWYSMLGAHPKAYEVMNRSLDDFGAKGTIGAAWHLLWLPELAAFREDAGFAHIAQRMRLPDYWNKHGPPDGYDWRGDRLIPR